MSNTPENFSAMLRAGVEEGRLPLTPVTTPHGIVMGAIRKQSLDRYDFPDVIFNTLTLIGARSDGLTAVEGHTQQWGLRLSGVSLDSECAYACNSYLVGAQEVVHLRPTSGQEFSRSNAADMFDPDRDPHKHEAREVLEGITNLYDPYLLGAMPGEDIFHPANTDARAAALQTIVGHTILDPAFRVAIEQLR